MNVKSKIHRGEGAFWGAIKRLAQAMLQVHIPVGGPPKVIFSGLYGLHVAVREGCLWSARFGWYEPLFRSQCECVGHRFRMEQLPYLQGRGRLILGDDVQLSGKPSFTFGSAVGTVPKLKIGNGTFIAHNVSIAAAGSVIIGDNCLIANSANIRDYDGHPLDSAERRSGRRLAAEEIRPVQLGDDVWIGAQALILKGVTIGDGSVVAAGAIVTKDVPANVVVAGNPARIVKHLTLASGDGLAAARTAVEMPG